MKRTLVPAALAFTLGMGTALAQAPIERQAPDSQSQAAPQDQPGGPPPQMSGHRRPPHRDPNKEAAHLARELSLSPDQQAKLAGAFADRDQKMSALHENTALDEQAKRQQMRAIHKDSENQLASILTPDQLQQMKAMRHRGPGGPGGPGGPQGPPPPPSN